MPSYQKRLVLVDDGNFSPYWTLSVGLGVGALNQECQLIFHSRKIS